LPGTEVGGGSEVWREALRHANCMRREIVISKARYSCKLLRVPLKLFSLNTSYLFLTSARATLG